MTARRDLYAVLMAKGPHSPQRSEWCTGLIEAFRTEILREAGKVTPSGGEATQPADFYQPGHTYGDDEYGWAFRCDSITAHPADGERTALGWRLFKGQWEPYAYGEDDWEIHQVVGMTEDAKDGVR